ncbi:MAG: hypothetical protein K6A35_06725 [bacterium]|nr:hypothetical protein [bacterium]
MISSLNSFDSINSNMQMASVAPKTEASEPREVEFSYQPQDAVVMEPVSVKIPVVNKGILRPETPNVKFGRSIKKPIPPIIRPNRDGNYVFDSKTQTKKFIAVDTMATVQHTFDEMKSIFGEGMTFAHDREKISLFADKGEKMNAYYTRLFGGSLNFFHSTDPLSKEKFYTGSSGEVISHEVGHAILDGQRPWFMLSFNADTQGFHEAFADSTALFMSTQSDETCQLAAQQCGGDLRQDNCLANCAEQFGQVINKRIGTDVTGGNYLRTFRHDYKWQDPSTVPAKPDADHPITTEMHDWSQIFTGAQYDILTDITARNIREGMDPAQAIKAAGRESMEILAGAVKTSPERDASYRDMAMCMLKYDAENNDGRNHDVILDNMIKRNILQEGDDTPTAADMQAMSSSENVTVTLSGPEYGMFSGAEVTGSSRHGAPSLLKDLKNLIKNGSILYTEPNQSVTKEDLFDRNGNAYVGVVRWVDGKMTIEQTGMIS